MKSRIFIAVAVLVASLVVPSASFGAPVDNHPASNAAGGKVKTVKLTFRNDSASVMELKLGDDLVTIDPGKSLNVRLPRGTRVIANSKTEYHEVGGLIAEVSDSLSGAIVHIK